MLILHINKLYHPYGKKVADPHQLKVANLRQQGGDL